MIKYNDSYRATHGSPRSSPVAPPYELLTPVLRATGLELPALNDLDNLVLPEPRYERDVTSEENVAPIIVDVDVNAASAVMLLDAWPVQELRALMIRSLQAAAAGTGLVDESDVRDHVDAGTPRRALLDDYGANENEDGHDNVATSLQKSEEKGLDPIPSSPEEAPAPMEASASKLHTEATSAHRRTNHARSPISSKDIDCAGARSPAYLQSISIPRAARTFFPCHNHGAAHPHLRGLNSHITTADPDSTAYAVGLIVAMGQERVSRRMSVRRGLRDAVNQSQDFPLFHGPAVIERPSTRRETSHHQSSTVTEDSAQMVLRSQQSEQHINTRLAEPRSAERRNMPPPPPTPPPPPPSLRHPARLPAPASARAPLRVTALSTRMINSRIPGRGSLERFAAPTRPTPEIAAAGYRPITRPFPRP